MVPPDKERITFYLRKDLVKELNKAAKSMHMNKSNFIEWLLETALPRVEPMAKMMKDIFQASIQMKKQNEEN